MQTQTHMQHVAQEETILRNIEWDKQCLRRCPPWFGETARRRIKQSYQARAWLLSDRCRMALEELIELAADDG